MVIFWVKDIVRISVRILGNSGHCVLKFGCDWVQGLFAPRYFRSSERKFPLRTFAPGSESSRELSLPGAKVLGNFRAKLSLLERKFSGTFAPGNESSRELSLPGTKVPGNFRSRDSQFVFFSDKYSLLMIITLIPRRRKTIHVCYRRCLQ